MMLPGRNGTTAEVIDINSARRKTVSGWRRAGGAVLAAMMLAGTIGCDGAPLTTRERARWRAGRLARAAAR